MTEMSDGKHEHRQHTREVMLQFITLVHFTRLPTTTTTTTTTTCTALRHSNDDDETALGPKNTNSFPLLQFPPG